MFCASDTVLALRLAPTCWHIARIKAVLDPLKTKKEVVMLTKKAGLFSKCLTWRGFPVRRPNAAVEGVPSVESSEHH